jgi:hypothetical protein
MKKEFLLLILAGLLSIFLIKFDLRNGFEYLGVDLNLTPIDFAGKSSTEKFLTTQIFGYLIFALFIKSIKKYLNHKSPTIFWGFMTLLIIGVYIESVAIYENIIGEYLGRHCRIGITLTIIGIVSLISIQRLRKQS